MPFSIGQEIAKKYMQDLVVTEKVAVICFNDELALGMYAFLTGKGIEFRKNSITGNRRL